MARAHRVVRPDMPAAERPNPSEEEIEQARLADFQKMYRDAEQARSDESSEDDDSEGSAEPDDEDSEDYSQIEYRSGGERERTPEGTAFVPPVPRAMSLMDFGDLPNFRSLIDVDDIEMIKKMYPWRPGYLLRAPELGDRADRPPPGTVAIYSDQLEAGLRIPISDFTRDCLRFWAVQITQLTPNAIRVVVGFELICRLLEINELTTFGTPKRQTMFFQKKF